MSIDDLCVMPDPDILIAKVDPVGLLKLRCVYMKRAIYTNNDYTVSVIPDTHDLCLITTTLDDLYNLSGSETIEVRQGGYVGSEFGAAVGDLVAQADSKY